MLTRDNVQDIYGLAPMQEGMLIQYAREPDSTAYVEQFDFHLEGPLDAPVLERSLNVLIAKYDVLRTVFSYRKTDLPRQIVLKTRTLELERLTVADPDPEEVVAAFKATDRQRGFDLSRDLLLRATLLSLDGDHHRLIVTFHHIILDGWCLGPLFQDLFGYYEQLLADPQRDIREREPHPYRDYIRWVEAQDPAAAREHWQACLQDYRTPVGPPYFDRSWEGGREHAVHLFALGEAATARLEAAARELRLTVNALFQTAWGIVLQKFHHSRDVVFGAVVSGRPPELTGVEGMIGLFINTQPLRVTVREGESVAAVAARVQDQTFRATPYAHHPLFEIQADTPLKNRLLDHVVAFENYPLGERLRRLEGPVRVTRVEVFEQTPYDFNVIVQPGADLSVNFTYNRRRYEAETVALLERSLTTLLEQVARDPHRPVAELSICAPADRVRVLEAFNATAAPYPRDTSLGELFARTAARHSQAPALSHGGRRYSYTQLQEQAGAVAAALAERGVGPGDRVGLLAPRCPELIFAILGILQRGAAYVPLDPASPGERTAFMLEDSDAALVCTLADLGTRLPESLPRLLLDRLEACRPPPSPPVAAEAAAYVMYTSGSTGRPKGCRVSHRNIARLVLGSDLVDFGPRHRILLSGAPVFDASTFEIWGALLHGAELVLTDEADLLDPPRLKALLAEREITLLWLTSALFNQHCEADPTLFAPLEALLVGGDVLSPRHIRRVQQACPELTVINGYGPTENTTFSATFPIRAEPRGRIPIGKPIANSSAYVVDDQLQLLPPGAYGELCLGGDGVALGYLNRPELSAEKFRDDPFRPGGRLYRSGDIARWLPDGTLDLLGRTDFQVKIRGFRVEPGEIERALGELPGVAEAVVVAIDGPGGQQLHAYYSTQCRPGEPQEPRQLRQALGRRLPEYMIPAGFQHLPRLPLTGNGKVDRRALPPPRAPEPRTVTGPRSDLEARIVVVFREVLGGEVDIHDNFFDLGANSLTLVTLNNRLKGALERDIPLTALFEHTTVARLADYLAADPAADPAQGHAARQAQEQVQLDQARNKLLKTRKLMRALD